MTMERTVNRTTTFAAPRARYVTLPRRAGCAGTYAWICGYMTGTVSRSNVSGRWGAQVGGVGMDYHADTRAAAVRAAVEDAHPARGLTRRPLVG